MFPKDSPVVLPFTYSKVACLIIITERAHFMEGHSIFFSLNCVLREINHEYMNICVHIKEIPSLNLAISFLLSYHSYHVTSCNHSSNSRNFLLIIFTLTSFN